MDQIAIVKERVRREEWAERVRLCSKSGLTVSEWCKQNNINPKTYYYHLRKFRREICEQIEHRLIPMISISVRFQEWQASLPL